LNSRRRCCFFHQRRRPSDSRRSCLGQPYRHRFRRSGYSRAFRRLAHRGATKNRR
jgi:hypothetical protein